MLPKTRELIYAVIAMGVITLAYLVVQAVNQGTPSASSLWGHSLGIFGFVLMLMTETLYSLRKRTRRSRWGRMARWLEFHIFTGLVGPFMVLLHPGWQFKGLAGVLSLLTVLIVISGFIGRYIYTAIPRTADGIELTLEELEQQAAEIENALARLAASGQAGAVIGAGSAARGSAAVATTPARSVVSGANRELQRIQQSQARLRREQARLRRIIARRQTSRRLFSLWHTIHIPLGLTLFLIAFIHIGAAVYYATLLR